MHHDALHSDSRSWAPSEGCLALSLGAVLLLLGAKRRNSLGMCLMTASAPFLYRGVVGRWPPPVGRGGHRPYADEEEGDTRRALRGARGVHVRESIRLEMPISEVYQFWRNLENLPRFMRHLHEVTNTGDGRSHWVAAGPAGINVEWDAEIINDVENQLIAWRSLPGSDIVTAGSVNFDEVRGGRSTQVTVHLQYATPGGKAGSLLAKLFGREPSQTIREDLRHIKQWLETGEIARAHAPENEGE